MHLKVLCYFCALLMCFYFVQGQDKVSVTVYYESLCPDSKKFFNSELYPNLVNANISKWVNLTLVPYGKSTKTKVDDQWQFSCHHGTYECLGNKIHACALHEIEKLAPTPAGLGFNPITVAFINCVMAKAENITAPGKPPIIDFHVANCSDINHVPNYVAIENCENHPTSTAYLAEMGDLTDKLEPKLKSVPTIVFDGKHKVEESEEAGKHFVKVLCRHIQTRTQDVPQECKSGATKLAFSVLAFALLFITHLF